MSISPKMLAGSAGVVQDQIQAGVLSCAWSRSRARWGEEVDLAAVISGWKDGTAVKLILYESDGGAAENDDLVTELEASLEKGIASASYAIDFEDPDSDEGDEYELYFRVEIEGTLLSSREQCPLLLVDMTLPHASE